MPVAPSIAFNDQGEPVPTTGFDYDAVARAVDGEQDTAGDLARVRQQTLARLLHFLTTRANAKRAGQRAHLLAYLIGQSPSKNQKQLARQLGVTPGAVSQKLNLLRREFRTLARAL